MAVDWVRDDPAVQARIDYLEAQWEDLLYNDDGPDAREYARAIRMEIYELEEANPLRPPIYAADVVPDRDMLAAWLASAGRRS